VRVQALCWNVAAEALFWDVTVVTLCCSESTGFVLECDGRGFVLQSGSRSSVLECQWKLYFRGLFQFGGLRAAVSFLDYGEGTDT